MIVKLIIHKKLDAISVWNEAGDRLYYSDKAADIDTAKKLLTIHKAKTDMDVANEKMTGKIASPKYEQVLTGYFNAYWLKGVVQLVKRAEGYSW